MKAKYLFLGLSLIVVVIACNNIPVGYLETENAQYTPDTTTIRLNPDASYMESPWGGGFWTGDDAIRVQNKAPWVTYAIQGVLGTDPMIYSIEEVKSANSNEDADYFKSNLTIIGSGIMYYPLFTDSTMSALDSTYTYINNTPAGEYTVSIRITNPGYTAIIKDAMIFKVE